MKRTILLLFALLGISLLLFSQDTIRIGPPVIIKDSKEPIRGKGIFISSKYAREEIVFNDRHMRVEYCHYHRGKRYSYGETYYLLGENTLVIGDSTYPEGMEYWTYKKLWHGSFWLTRGVKGGIESGLAKKIMPLERAGHFVTTSKDFRDTLWITDYGDISALGSNALPSYFFPKRTIEGPIYDETEVDELPLMANGDTIPEIDEGRLDYCFCEPMTPSHGINFIVGADGQIKQVRWYDTLLDGAEETCHLPSIIREIFRYGRLRPAYKDGVSVNVKIWLKVNAEW